MEANGHRSTQDKRGVSCRLCDLLAVSPEGRPEDVMVLKTVPIQGGDSVILVRFLALMLAPYSSPKFAHLFRRYADRRFLATGQVV